MKVLLIVIALAIIGVLAYTYYFAPISDVGVMDRFENKIVYTTDVAVDQEPLRRHCVREGGTFNSCGSVCDEGEICIDVCAFTCEF